MVELSILGPLQVRHDGDLVDLGGPKCRTLLAALLLRGGAPASPDVLVEALWGDHTPPPTAAKALHVHVSRLRRQLGPLADRVRTEPTGYRLLVAPGELDADRFARHVETGRRLAADGRPREAVDVLRQALALWRGPALADLRYETFAQPEIARLEELRALALEERVEAELALGEHALLVGELTRLVGEYPTRERLRGQLMLALYRAGRHADALAAYRQARGELGDELGLEPGPGLRRLEQAILTHDPELARAANALPALPPAPPTPTFGREADLRRITALLSETRCLTLVGLGGVGKTRLAVELARRLGGQFVSLASTTDAERVPAVICDALDIARAPGEPPEEALGRAVRRTPRLLVLDNLEHLPGAATLLARLLARHAELRVLATSRQPLRIQAERRFHVEPLPSDGDPSPAVDLFVDRARAQETAFAVTAETAPVVASICERLGGLPLAIELAAARLAVLTPEALAERLDDALSVLGCGPQDAPARHQTLCATLDWSFDLLSDAERDAFTALAAFSGGCELDAAEAVSRAPLPVLESLVSQGLVTARRARLTMLEPVRQYAVRRLADRPDAGAVRARHLKHYLALARRSEEAVWAARRASPDYAVLHREHDNLCRAVEWGLDAEPAAAIELVSALGCYTLFARASTVLREWLRHAGPDLPPGLRARAEYARGFNSEEAGERAALLRSALGLLRELDDERMILRCLIDLAEAENFAGRRARARATADEALRVAHRVGDEIMIGAALGQLAVATEDVEAGMRLAHEAAARLRAAGARVRSAETLSTVGFAALHHDAYGPAAQLGREALEDALAIGDAWCVAFVHGNTGLAALLGGDRAGAHTAFGHELSIAHAHGQRTFYFEGLLGLAALAALAGDDQRAATLQAAAWALNDRPIAPSEAAIYERVQANVARARNRLGEPAWCSASARGRTMTPDQAMTFALEAG